MSILYIKNYKGFNEEFIELSDINFFVGENSTGKTSVLKLISLLSSNEFWNQWTFNNSQVELGYFDEIINKKSASKSFRIGFEKTRWTGDVETVERHMLEFVDRDNIPKISLIKSTYNNQAILIKFTEKQIRYKFTDSEKEFEDWVKNTSVTRDMKIQNLFPTTIPFFILRSIMIAKIDSSYLEKSSNLVNVLLFHDYIWLAPIRAKAKRIYESYNVKFSPEGDHIPAILKGLLDKSKNKKALKGILEKFGRESNLFDKIQISELGKKNSSPFEISILYANTPIKLSNVGYGVSQSLPLIVEILRSFDTAISIQQPEVHLHPKAQAAFGSFLLSSFLTNKNKFMIETHSDFTINRLRHDLSKAQDKKTQPKVKVMFFERTSDGNKITHLNVSSEGAYESDVPISYRDFFIDEELKLLEL